MLVDKHRTLAPPITEERNFIATLVYLRHVTHFVSCRLKILTTLS